MYRLPADIAQCCLDVLGAVEIRSAAPISGGDINEALLLETAVGRFLLKMNTAPQAASMFAAEAAGLGLLAASNTLRTPAVLGHGSAPSGSFLLLEYVEPGPRTRFFWEKLGAGLAALHRCTASYFGLDHDNFIGSLRQQNHRHAAWPSFFIQERLRPQLALAQQRSLFQSADMQLFERLFERLPSLCPVEPPALVHGDLWSGNILCGAAGNPVLIDPSACFAHREMDLAMSRLFGGFDRRFYLSYGEAWPLNPGFEERLPLYQLYYLLAHVNLFGGGYVPSVRAALRSLV